jgi:uncharacterized protein (TIGR00661 family)
VYYPFQSLDFLIDLVEPFTDHHFFIYHAVVEPIDMGHIHIRPYSRSGFHGDLVRAGRVICGAGFGLVSESLSIGKTLLVHPMEGQLEQLSNALALETLGLASVCEKLTHDSLREFLENGKRSYIESPDVANELVRYIEEGNYSDTDRLVQRLWQKPQIKYRDEAKGF